MNLTVPVLVLDADWQCVDGQDTSQVKLYGSNRRLVMGHRQIKVYDGALLNRKLSFDEDIVSACYTTFHESDNVLAVCVRKAAHLFYPDGRSYVVSFPFAIARALPFESGLVLEKDPLTAVADLDRGHHLAGSKFFTVVDPIGTFKSIAALSVSVISPREELVIFPDRSINKHRSLCVTFNSHDKSIILYNVRLSARSTRNLSTYGSNSNSNSNSGSGSGSVPSSILGSGPSRHTSKRKYSLLAPQNAARMFDEDSERDQTLNSINMEKKRTSTLLSDASSLARMRSEPGVASHDTKTDHAFEYGTFQKDMILAKLETFNIKTAISNITLRCLSFDDQEAVILVDRLNKEAKVFVFKHLMNTPMYQASYSFQCMDCIPLEESYVIVLKEPNQLCLVNLFLDVMSPKVMLPAEFPAIQRFGSSADSNVTLLDNLGVAHLLHFVMQPSSDFVLRCLNCFKYLAGSRLEETIWMMWRTALMLDNCRNEWNAFVITLLALIFPFNANTDNHTGYVQNEITVLLEKAKYMGDAFKADYNIPDMIPYIALALHLIREEARLDIFASKDLFKLNVLMTQLSVWMGWPESWVKYYGINLKSIDKQTRFLLVLVLERPPNLLESLVSLFSNQIVKYLMFSQLVEEGESADELITPRTHHTLKLFEILVSPSYGPGYIVDMMCAFDIDTSKLETYPQGICIPLKNAILRCQEDTSFEWTEKSLAITGRKDLQMLFSEDPVEYVPHVKHQPKDYHSILGALTDKNDSMVAWDGQSEADRINVTKLLFDKDRRFYEITTLLHQTRVQTATLMPESDVSEYDLLLQQRELAVVIALRTLTIPMGRAALFYGSRKPILTERFPIPKFNLNCLIAPSMTNIVLTEKSLDENITEWGYFHNGVSSGLSINKDSNGISGSWIIFNKPNELNAQHAGFLLGIGLNGHLKRLEEWHIYNYLGPKHPLTSVGLLVGMAASLRGTMDNKLTKVLSVHAVALLPQGANDLNVPVVVQTAGLIGIGLLYLETQHRRMSEILLAQVTSSVFQNDTEIIHEGYRFSAGVSLGLVNLGKGEDLSGLNDTHVVEKLLLLATSMKDYQPVQELDKSCCGSILALAFIYLKTHNVSVAEKLRVPQSEQFLDYIRPDLLLLRCLARNLILWDEIGNTMSWVKGQVPSAVWAKHSSLKILDSDQVSYLNLLGGACLSIAIKYASSGDIVARDTILYFMSELNRYTQLEPTNYDQRIVLRCGYNMQNLLALSVSIVMAGSGDLETLRYLRIMYHDAQSKSFGSYMAINMALGFLFLGDGQYAFGNSNFAIACLVISIYPIFPSQENENDIHLQALRHLWALSIEPRCLVVRDVVTQKPLKVAVQLQMNSGVSKHMTSPCLLPNIEEISGIETLASDYFKVAVRLDGRFRDLFRKSMTIYVYKKSNYEMLKQSVSGLLANESKQMQIRNGEVKVDPMLEWFLKGSHFAAISAYERLVMCHEGAECSNQGEWAAQYNDNNGLSVFNIIDTKFELQSRAAEPQGFEDLWNLKLLFAYADHLGTAEMAYVLYEFVQGLKQAVWSVRGSRGR